MKRLFLAGMAGLVFAQGAPAYQNNATVYNPDFNINDPLFINGVGAQFLVYNLLQSTYRTYNTLNYTNYGLMEANVGFQFDTYSGSITRWADSFFNDSFGVVNAGVSSNGLILYTSYYSAGLATPRIIISATNVVNRGLLSVAPEGILAINGRNVDLSRSRLNVAAFEYSPYDFYPFGQFDGYWGLRDVEFNPAVNFGNFGSTPSHWVTNRYYTTMRTSLYGTPHVRAVTDYSTSNTVVNVAFILNSHPADFTINPYALGSDMWVEWVWNRPDPLAGTNGPAYMYLEDSITTHSNLTLMTNGYGPPSTGFRPTLIPTNYYFYASSSPLFLGTPMPMGSTSGLFPNTNITRESTAYEIQFSPTLSLPEDFANRTYTNMPGRIELVAYGANSSLNLQRTRIYGPNSLVLKATNHFAGSGGAKIVTPFADLDLGTSSGSLVISNLLSPVVPRLEGYVDLWSTRFTNVNAANFTNSYHVLFVNSYLRPTVEPRLQNLALRGSNVIISDVLNVLDNLSLRAQSVTILSNAPGVANPVGELNLLSGRVFDASSSPGLLRLTNYGVLSSQNLMFFTNQSRPYEAFVNYGTVTDTGSLIAADYFWNSGGLTANGSIISLSCREAWLRDGYFLAPASDISLRGNSLQATNHVLRAGRALTLAFTNYLDDGSLTNSLATLTNRNFWSVGAGMNLPVRPPLASLLATTITNSAPPDSEIQNLWAGQDRGCDPRGYDNNAALGQLVLNGGEGSTFYFNAPGVSNALYVDVLELRGATAVRDTAGNFPGIEIAPNMKIYFADARVDGVSVAEKMNGKNNGRLCWISSYTGFLSSTNMIYPDGTTNVVNLALAQSCNLDSDQDGLVNCADLTPVLAPSQIRLRLTTPATPTNRVQLAWQTLGGAMNRVEYLTDLSAPAWQPLTNFVSGASGTATASDVRGTGPRFYRVRVEVTNP